MKRYTVLFFILLSCFNVWAQGIMMTSEVRKKTITLDEELIISYTIRGGKEITKLDIPSNFSFRITNEFQSYRTEYINNTTPTTTFTKTFTLQPLVTGTFVFPKAMAIVDGFTVYSQPVKVNILKGNKTNNSNNELRRIPVSLLSKNEDPNKKVSDNIEVVQSVNKQTCYVGENIISTIKLYARLQAKYNITTLSTYTGFSIEDQYTSYQLDPKVVQYKGTDYSMNEIRSVHLFPLTVGELSIEPLSIEANVPLQREINNQQYENFVQNSHLYSNKLKVNVLPLPKENKPNSFTGAVGSFNIQATIENENIFAEELNQLEIIIAGQGNLPLIHLPKWNIPEAMTVSQTQIVTDYRKELYPFTGAKKFVIPFYIKNAGTVTIPSIEFSYFDPTQKKYLVTQTNEIKLNVAPATIQNRRTIIEVDQINNWWLLLIPIAFFMFVVLYRIRKKQQKNVPISNTSNTKAHQMSFVYFDATKKAYWNNDFGLFYKNLKDYIIHLIEEKDQVKVYNQKSLENHLETSSFSVYQKELIKELFHKAQINRFSQMTYEIEHQQDFQKFEKLSQSI